MIANKEKTNSPKKDDAKDLFEHMGRKSTNFSKAVYETINRRKPPLLKEKSGLIGLSVGFVLMIGIVIMLLKPKKSKRRRKK